jgi:hypothetical protein
MIYDVLYFYISIVEISLFSIDFLGNFAYKFWYDGNEHTNFLQRR